MLKRYVVLCMLFFISCSKPIKFDKEKWLEANDDEDFMYRSDMLKDLMANYTLIGIPTSSLKALLGKADSEDPYTIDYEISDEYPFLGKEHIKMVRFGLNKDSIVISIKIVERDDDFEFLNP